MLAWEHDMGMLAWEHKHSRFVGAKFAEGHWFPGGWWLDMVCSQLPSKFGHCLVKQAASNHTAWMFFFVPLGAMICKLYEASLLGEIKLSCLRLDMISRSLSTLTWGLGLEKNRSKMMTPNLWERFWSFKFLAPNLWSRTLTSNHLFEFVLLISWCPTSNIQ